MPLPCKLINSFSSSKLHLSCVVLHIRWNVRLSRCPPVRHCTGSASFYYSCGLLCTVFISGLFFQHTGKCSQPRCCSGNPSNPRWTREKKKTGMPLTGIVHPKMKMCSSSDHPRRRWVCFFIRTDLEKSSIKSLVHQWMLCSEWVPLEWESKQLIIIIIHSTPVHQLMSWEAKNCMFVKEQTNPSVRYLPLNPHF